MQPSSLPVALMSMIDIDASILVQAAIVLILYAILRPLVFEPFLQASALRLEKTEEARRAATELAARAQAMAARYETELAAARLKAHAARGELRAEGLRLKETAVGEARQATAAELETLRLSIESQTAQARTELTSHVEQLSRTLVERLLGRAV
jgi:F-type H+-transporting ATPase subunit b